MSKQKHPEQQQQWNDGKKREGACKYLHFQIINILWAARLYKEIKQKNGFSWDGFCHIFPPLLLSKILRGPSTTSERHMKIGSSGVRVKALLGTSPKEKTWTQRWKKKFQCSGMHHLDSIFLPFLSHSHPLSQALFQTGIQCFFLLCLQRKSLAFYSAAKVLYALTIIKLDWNPFLFLSTQTDKSSTPYNKCLIRGVGWFFWMSHY